MTERIVIGSEFIHKLCEAIGENPATVQRIVIDIGYPGDVVTIYVEKLGTDKMLNVFTSLEGVKIEVKEVK